MSVRVDESWPSPHHGGNYEAMLVRAAVAATLRTAAGWGLAWSDNNRPARDHLHEIADQVDRLDGDEMCCPVCEETTCDDDCPLAEVRANPAAR